MQPSQPTTSLGGLKCPKCDEEIVVGIGVPAPEVLYALTPGDLEKRKAEFLEAVKNSTMSEEQKSNIDKIYGDPKVMIDPQALAVMHEEVKKNYSGVKLG
jgi:hypothetical protein